MSLPQGQIPASHRIRPTAVGIIVGLVLRMLALVHDLLLAWGQAGQAASDPQRPTYQIGSAGRFNEDWSVLRGVDMGATDDFWDRRNYSSRSLLPHLRRYKQ